LKVFVHGRTVAADGMSAHPPNEVSGEPGAP
jgi:hypothetical protein